jgi:hypothetical protein
MSGSDPGNGQAKPSADGASVLANLPHTRPQRSSARRAAARAAGAGAAASELAGETAQRTQRDAQGRPRTKASRPTRAKSVTAPAAKRRKTGPARRSAAGARGSAAVPRQGYESESDRASGPVQPPGGTELVASAVEIVGELAKSGFATGERLLKDVFSRLSPS